MFIICLYLINITSDHVKDGVENLHIELLHRQELLLSLVEGESARVDSPQPAAGDNGRKGRGQVTPRLLILHQSLI